MKYGRAIKFVRSAKSWSQAKLANESGLTAGYISLVENGQRAPSLGAIEKIANALGVPLYLLMLLAAGDRELRGISREQAQLLATDLLDLAIRSDPRKGRR
jgi:transcriptional regulator with XRE-family HTH domain